MRKITAKWILGPEGEFLENHTLIVDNETINGLEPVSLYEAEEFEGILIPGFINSHCHLELSYLKNKIISGNGLHNFIKEFVHARKTYTHGIDEQIKNADALMWENGIQGVGDICNVDFTFEVKQQSKIVYHNFIELFNLNPNATDEVFNNGEMLEKKAGSLGLKASIVPHAPYSVPQNLFLKIKEHQKQDNTLWSIHNQESVGENEMFKSGRGKLWETFNEMGVDLNWFQPTGKNSMESINKYFTNSKLLFVHNTYTTQEDIDFLKSMGLLRQSYFCFCVKANLFIENQMPNLELFIRNECNMVIGTDSLASNDTLSILEELKVLHTAFPQVDLATLFSMATKNGADYFGWNNFGSFSRGKKPGVIQITSAGNNFINGNAKVVRII